MMDVCERRDLSEWVAAVYEYRIPIVDKNPRRDRYGSRVVECDGRVKGAKYSTIWQHLFLVVDDGEQTIEPLQYLNRSR